jgi:hypothetical protein
MENATRTERRDRGFPKHLVVVVNITTPDGELLDRFPVTHWRYEERYEDIKGGPDSGLEDCECVGSNASQSLLVERIARYVGD